MLLIFESYVYNYAKNLDIVSGFNSLSFNSERFPIQFIRLRGEVYDYCFLYLKSYSTPPFLIKCFIDDCFNTLLVTLR